MSTEYDDIRRLVSVCLIINNIIGASEIMTMNPGGKYLHN